MPTKKSKKKERKERKVISSLRKEFNSSMNTAIIAAFGFLIALAWRDLITQAVDKLLSYSPLEGALIATIFTTLLGVGGILLVSYFFKKDN